jgi:hypothetical protein
MALPESESRPDRSAQTWHDGGQHTTVALGLIQEARTTTSTDPKTISVNGVTLHYIEQGRGTAVVFVHGG